MAHDEEATAVDALSPDELPRRDGMPLLGLGTWELTDERQCPETVRTALEAGYRHVDTAQAYGNEELVGDGIAAADVDREEVFLATKIWISNLGYEDAKETAYESLDRLGTDHVDLLYVHWPAGEYDPAETLTALEELHEEGVAERIGVSNFEPDQLAEAVERTSVPIFANQFECHPLLPQRHLLAACEEHDVHPVAYSPLARGDVFDVPEIQNVAESHGVSAAQVALAWLREQGIAAIPKATGAEHVRDNFRSLALELDDEEVARLDGLNRTERKVDPDFAPW